MNRIADFDDSAFIESQITAVKETIDDEKALVDVSEGVVSTVSVVITHRSIRKNLVCAFIDDNFMRLGEVENIRYFLSSEPLNLPMKVVKEKQ